VRALGVLLLKEELVLFTSSIAYVILSVFTVLMGYNFSVNLFLTRGASLVHLFFQVYVLLLLMVPAITMRAFAEERKAGTLELLLTAPVSEVQIVLAKFLACWSVAVVMVGLSTSYAVVLGVYGDPDWGPIVSGYLGLLLLGAALVGVGVVASSLTANQVVAALATLGVFLLLWMIDSVGYLLPPPLDSLVLNLALVGHFTPFVTGSLYLSDVGYFLTITLLGLFLAVRALARR
jgi:ABC-2 type transport system permease protein